MTNVHQIFKLQSISRNFKFRRSSKYKKVVLSTYNFDTSSSVCFEIFILKEYYWSLIRKLFCAMKSLLVFLEINLYITCVCLGTNLFISNNFKHFKNNKGLLPWEKKFFLILKIHYKIKQNEKTPLTYKHKKCKFHRESQKFPACCCPM